MNKTVKWSLIGAGCLVGLAVIGMVLATILIDPNKYKPESQFSGIGYYANIMVEQSCDEIKPEGKGRYMLRVNDCQANASLIGLDLLSDEGITFTNLAECVFPDAPDGYFD